MAFGWLSERSDEKKKSHPENVLVINRNFALTSYCNTIGQGKQCLLHIRVFFGGKRRVHALIFHWLRKQITNTYRNHWSYENRSNNKKPNQTKPQKKNNSNSNNKNNQDLACVASEGFCATINWRGNALIRAILIIYHLKIAYETKFSQTDFGPWISFIKKY